VADSVVPEQPAGGPSVESGPHFAVFLSHNSRDKRFVERVAERLKRAGLEPWLDAWSLVPGEDWQQGVAAGLAASESCAVFVGPADLGAWSHQEVAVALDRVAKDPDFRLFLVLLPGLPEQFDSERLSPFLRMRTWVDYRGGLDDQRAFRSLICAVQGLPLGPEVAIESREEVCPYRGLEVFDEEHADFFFGRDGDIQRLLERFKTTRFLAVLGASGSGKSSLVRAGLVPALRRGTLSGSSGWEVALLRPGAHPLESLSAQLVRRGNGVGMQTTLDALATDARTLHLAGSLLVGERGGDAQLLVVVDQFEEVFTLCHGEAERRAFFANLLYAASVPAGHVRVLLTMRADFYHRCAGYPELAQQLAVQQYLVSPLEREGLRQAIEEPARRVGLSFEPGLVATILDDVADDAGGLPLLEHALLELWRRRTGGLLTLAAYRATGGVAGAIAKRAEEVFQSLDPSQQRLARRTFLRLTQPGEGAEDTRRRAQLTELDDAGDEVAAVVTQLVNARLVTIFSDEIGGDDVVEVAHEALIRGWPRMRGWVDEDRAGLRVHRRLTEAAQEWERLGRDPSLLYRGARLAGAVEWRDANEESLNEFERAFLDASRSAEQDELEQARRRTRRLRAVVAGLVVLLAAVVGVAALAKRQTDEANTQQRVASSRALAATALSYLDDSPDVAMLLGLEAYRLVKDDPPAQRFEARSTLVTTLQQNARLTAVLRAPADGAALSTDGRTLALANDDRDEVTVWDIGRRVSFKKPFKRRDLEQIAISPDGRTLVAVGTTFAAAGSFRRVKLWNVGNGNPIGEILLSSGDVGSLAFSADSRTLAIGERGGTLTLWDVRRGPPARIWSLGKSCFYTVTSIAFSPDGRTVAWAEDDGRIRLSSVASGETTGKPFAHGPLVGASEVTTGFAIGSGSRADSRCTGSRSLYPIASIAFSPDGTRLASAGQSTVRIWNTATQAPVGQPLDLDDVSDVVFSRDGSTIVGSSSESMMLWDRASHNRLAEPLDLGDGVFRVAFSPAGNALVALHDDGTVTLWNVARRAPFRDELESRSGTSFLNAVFSADGNLLASEGSKGTVRLWDMAHEHPRLKAVVQDEMRNIAIAFSRDGTTLASVGNSGVVRFWNVKRRVPLRVRDAGNRLYLGPKVSNVALSPDIRRVAAAYRDGTLRLWDVARRAVVAKALYRDRERGGRPSSLGDEGIIVTNQSVELAFSPDGKTIASDGRDGRIRLWSGDGLTALGDLVNGDADDLLVSPRRTLGFSPDGRMLASAGGGNIRLWNVASRAQVGILEAAHEWLVTMAFSPDGETLVTVGVRGDEVSFVRLWDVARRAPLGVALPVYEYDVGNVVFSPRGEAFASTGGVGPAFAPDPLEIYTSEFATLTLWDSTLASTDYSNWRERICAIVRRNLTAREWRRLIPDRPYPETASSRSCPPTG
jgi:WD40 repeat protein